MIFLKVGVVLLRSFFWYLLLASKHEGFLLVDFFLWIMLSYSLATFLHIRDYVRKAESVWVLRYNFFHLKHALLGFQIVLYAFHACLDVFCGLLELPFAYSFGRIFYTIKGPFSIGFHQAQRMYLLYLLFFTVSPLLTFMVKKGFSIYGG